ncbi:MAG: hypothetical protein Q4A19_07755 [Johnsonella sp.]|nr:hypothetical protein [Johnsonella sp.]
MSWIVYLLVFFVICAVGFFIRRIWMALIDLIISLFKKIFGLNKKKSTKEWHTLDEIRDKNKEDEAKKEI